MQIKLIDKDAVVAEIERRLNYRVESLKAINNGTFWDKDQSEDEFNKSLTRCAFNAAKNELFELKCFLDTLEVKEVDLNREMQAFAFLYLEPLKISDSNIGISITMAQLYRCAKHFFELGLKVQKGEDV